MSWDFPTPEQRKGDPLRQVWPETLAAMIRRILSDTRGERPCQDSLGGFIFSAAAVAELGGQSIPNSRNLHACLADLEEWEIEELRKEDPKRLAAASALAHRAYEMGEAWHERQRREKRQRSEIPPPPSNPPRPAC